MALKGEVTIELTNKITGRKRTVSGHNMITNAYNKFISLCALSALAGQSFPQAKTTAVDLLGGLVIYSDNLVDNADNYVIKGDGTLLGKAGQYNSQAANKGSYNTLESGATSTGYRHVWDFSTSQCNGIIKALSLTHPYSTDDSVHNYQLWGSSYGETGFGKSLYYDIDNAKYYCFTYTSTNNIYTVDIYELDIPCLNLKVGDNFLVRKNDTGESTKIISGLVLGDGQQIYEDAVAWDAVTNKAYIPTYLGSKIVEFDCVNKTGIVKTIDLPVGKQTRYNSTIRVYGGSIYYWGDNSKLVRVNIDDNSDYHIFDDFTTSNSEILELTTDGLVVRTDSAYYKLLTNDTYFPTNENGTTAGRSFSPFIRASMNSGSEWSRMYLSFKQRFTIFNLPSPVTKTAAQTMKVIYTLTDA